MPQTRRIESIDFWRGLALLFIFVDHLPGNPLAGFTPRNFGFSDATEGFIFLSGVSLAYVYWPKFVAGEAAKVGWRCLRRAGQIYSAHMAVSASVLAIFAIGYFLSGHAELLGNDGRAQFFTQPIASTIGLFALGYQLGYANVLPVYVALLFMAPVLMDLLRHRLWLGLSVSIALYIAAQFGLRLPSWPGPDTWFLDPFAWQLLFTLGLAAGIHLHSWDFRQPFPISPFLLAVAVGVLLFALAVETDAFGLAPGLSARATAAYFTDKQLLGYGRLGHFLALAYVLLATNAASRLLRIPGAREISRLGRNSLTVFSVGIVLSAVGQLTLDLCMGIENPYLFGTIGLSVLALGGASLLFLAKILEWKKARHLLGRAESAPTAVIASQNLPAPSRSF
ncbi:MAG TPA: OpgC domain-containing protein [Beijerinckiaceae bacterium]|nr:OpgC domain-containing protein [Beijerinckiaceae bacterium]